MSWIELYDYLSDVAILESGFTDQMKRSLMNLQSFFNNNHGEHFNARDIKRYIEENCEMNIRIGIENRINGDGFEGGDEHKLNYAIKAIKQHYTNIKQKDDEQKQKEFQDKIIHSTMNHYSDEDIMKMFNGTSDNLIDDNILEPENNESADETANIPNEKEKTVRKEMSEEVKKHMLEMETRLSNKLSGIETLLSLGWEQSTVNEPKRKGRQRKNEKLLRCICCGEDKRADEAKKGIENDFYKSHSKIHSGCNGFIPICKDCLENIYANLESELAAAIKKVGIEVEEYYIEKKAIERICMMNDIYYNDSLFEAALKHSSNNTMLSAYMKINNLIQNKNKTYDDTFKENLKQEILGMKQEQGIDLSWMEDAV